MSSMERTWRLLFAFQIVMVIGLMFIFFFVMDEKFYILPIIRLKSQSSFKYMIYECTGDTICGGWADRLKGIVMTYLLSVMTKRRFKIHITSPSCNMTDYLEPNQLNWSVDVEMLKDLPHTRINHVGSETFSQSASSLNFSAVLTHDVIFYKGNFEYISGLQKNRYHAPELKWMQGRTPDQVFSYIHRHLFKLNKNLDTSVKTFMNKAKPNNRTSKLVCAQIRMGRNPTIPKDTELRNTPKEVEVVWNFIKNNLMCPDCKIFVSTDSEQMRAKAKEEFPNEIVDIPGQISHIERGSNSCDVMAKVILDQHILALCDTLIISKSGFGAIAAYLRGKKDNLYCFINGKVIPCLPSNIDRLYNS